MPSIEITEHDFKTPRHTSHYLSCGPTEGPLIIFTHGWPELSLSWRHQLSFFGAMGYRAVAPDMRGYGKSTVYPRHEDYAQEHIVQDMLELLEGLGGDKAVWVGHDWGAPVVWNMASHHPECCHGVANLCVPYGLERGLDFVISLADRDIYPYDQFPAAQWEYIRYYEENFDDATRPMQANTANLVKALFRKGSPEGRGQPAATAYIRKQGWFGGLAEAPAVPMDDDVITEAELSIFAESLERNGLFGPNSWYVNNERNADYSSRAVNGGVIDLPVLFLGARYDYTCETVDSRLAEPMRELCPRLTEVVIDSGHWMAQEKPFEVNREIVVWLVHQDLAMPG